MVVYVVSFLTLLSFQWLLATIGWHFLSTRNSLPVVTMADESKYPTRIAPYGLRMSPSLKARIQEVADKEGRSLHAELIHSLLEKYPDPNPIIHVLDVNRFIDGLIKVALRDTSSEGEARAYLFKVLVLADISHELIEERLQKHIANPPTSDDD